MKVYRLPEYLRSALQTPVGKLIRDEDLEESLADADPLIGVGDVTCLTLLGKGYRPKLILVDFKSERTVMPPEDPNRKVLTAYGDSTTKVNNPPAVITDELVDAIKQALTTDGAWRIEVDGEEDLAVLPCMVNAGEKAKIVYGMPGEGMVVVSNDLNMITWAQAFLMRMEKH